MMTVREPAVSGFFYPGDTEALQLEVNALLDAVPAHDTPAPKALIVPHAGYRYSGPVAATGYALVRRFRDQYTRVVLLGPCHRVAVRGLASSGADFFRTPLGDVPVDKSATAALDSPAVSVFDATHAAEHSLEVHLPFLQSVLSSFTLVPLVVGDVEPEILADIIDALWGGPETLIVVSSDLSHYLGYDEARAIDATTCDAIERCDAGILDHHRACGATPVRGLLVAARRHRLEIRTLDLRNSGDTAGDKQQVVGYGAWALWPV